MKYELPTYLKIQDMFRQAHIPEHTIEASGIDHKIWQMFQQLAPAVHLANAHLEFANSQKEHPAHERPFNTADNPLVVSE